jgi:hypothetical protein
MPDTSQSRRFAIMGALVGGGLLALTIVHSTWIGSGSATTADDPATSQRPAAVFVRFRGLVDVSSFDCRDITRDGFIRQVCHDGRRNEMIISLNGTHYAHCAIPASVVDGLMAASSMRRYYGAQVKGRYGC